MNDSVREKLRELVVKYGTSIGDDPKRLEGLLRDTCGGAQREIYILTLAAKESIPGEIHANESLLEILSARLSQRLEDKYGVTGELARWAVESWVLALGKVNPGKLNQDVINKKHTVPTEVKTDLSQKKYAVSMEAKNEVSSASANLDPPKVVNTQAVNRNQAVIKMAAAVGGFGAIGGFIGGLGWVLWLPIGVISPFIITFALLTGFYFKFSRRLVTPSTWIEIFFGLLIYIGVAIAIQYTSANIEYIWFHDGISCLIAGITVGLLLCFRIPNLNLFSAGLGGAIGALPITMNYFYLYSFSPIAIVFYLLFGFLSGFILVMTNIMFRKAWLVIDRQSGKQCWINLGRVPVKIGGDRQRCHIGIQGAPPFAYQYFVKDKVVYSKEETTRFLRRVSPGDVVRVGDALITFYKK